jgi:hypothetical protein
VLRAASASRCIRYYKNGLKVRQETCEPSYPQPDICGAFDDVDAFYKQLYDAALLSRE